MSLLCKSDEYRIASDCYPCPGTKEGCLTHELFPIDYKSCMSCANLQGTNPTSDDKVMVISITIGCILVLLLIGGLLFHLFRREKRRAANNPGTVNDDGNNCSGSLGEGTPSLDMAKGGDDGAEHLEGNTATEHTDYEPQEPR